MTNHPEPGEVLLGSDKPLHGCCLRASMVFALWVALPLLTAGQARVVLNGGNTLSSAGGTGNDGRTAAGPSAGANLGFPRGVAYDTAGNLYIADSRNHQIYRIAPDTSLAVIAGTGEQGFSGDGGAATSARLNSPYAVAVRADGVLFLCDTGNHRIRSISSNGVITTVAGTGIPGENGDSGPATAAELRRPTALAFDAFGNLLVADTGNHRIRRISTDGTITTFAGTGAEGDSGDGGPASAATFSAPSALLTLSDGSVLVSDTSARRIRRLRLDGSVTAYATGTEIRRPEGLTIGPTGDVLLNDADLQQLLQVSTNVTSAIAGNGMQSSFIAGQALTSSLDSPAGATTAADGSVAIADRRNHQVQRLALPLMEFGGIAAGQSSASTPLTLLNGGSSTLQITNIALPTGFHADSSGTCTALPIALSAGQHCTVGIVFKPQAQGATAAIAIVSTDVAPAVGLRMTGTGLPPATQASSQTRISSNGTVAYAGSKVQLTAVVTGNLSTEPGGNVSFSEGTTALSTVALTSATATYSTSALALGSHALRAVYSGDSRYAASTSNQVSVMVVPSPDFTFSASAASYAAKAGGTIAAPLTCLPQNGTLNHAVTFSITGMPTGFAATFAPPVVTLAANPAYSTLMISVPATLASNTTHSPVSLAAILLMLPFAVRRRRDSAMCATVACTLALNGCGGGFRTVSTTPETTTHSYNLTVTATTTGALGDTLVHSIPVELIITP